jgi:hypothetical protein
MSSDPGGAAPASRPACGVTRGLAVFAGALTTGTSDAAPEAASGTDPTDGSAEAAVLVAACCPAEDFGVFATAVDPESLAAATAGGGVPTARE